MTDVHSVDAASTTVDCRIHFFWQKFGKKVDVRTSTKSGCRIHYSEKSGCSIHIFNSDVHDIHSVDAAPTPGLTDEHWRGFSWKIESCLLSQAWKTELLPSLVYRAKSNSAVRSATPEKEIPEISVVPSNTEPTSRHTFHKAPSDSTARKKSWLQQNILSFDNCSKGRESIEHIYAERRQRATLATEMQHSSVWMPSGRPLIFVNVQNLRRTPDTWLYVTESDL